jgi:hypothetical protein
MRRGILERDVEGPIFPWSYCSSFLWLLTWMTETEPLSERRMCILCKGNSPRLMRMSTALWYVIYIYIYIRGGSKTFGEWYQKTNKTEDTNKEVYLYYFFKLGARWGVGSGSVWTSAENFAPPGLDPRIVQSVASLYTDYAIPAHCMGTVLERTVCGRAPILFRPVLTFKETGSLWYHSPQCVIQ